MFYITLGLKKLTFAFMTSCTFNFYFLQKNKNAVFKNQQINKDGVSENEVQIDQLGMQVNSKKLKIYSLNNMSCIFYYFIQ